MFGGNDEFTRLGISFSILFCHFRLRRSLSGGLFGLFGSRLQRLLEFLDGLSHPRRMFGVTDTRPDVLGKDLQRFEIGFVVVDLA